MACALWIEAGSENQKKWEFPFDIHAFQATRDTLNLYFHFKCGFVYVNTPHQRKRKLELPAHITASTQFFPLLFAFHSFQPISFIRLKSAKLLNLAIQCSTYCTQLINRGGKCSFLFISTLFFFSLHSSVEMHANKFEYSVNTPVLMNFFKIKSGQLTKKAP